jgi:AbiV family abortive infection protein
MADQEISEDYMRQGIRIILSNITKYVEDARLLIQHDSMSHAAVLSLYASEELGKAILLHETLESHKPNVDLKLFRGKEAHDRKMAAAKRLLGDSIILQSSVAGRARVPFILGAPDVEASPSLRMDCTYVDFRDGKWSFGSPFLVEHLDGLLNRLEKETATLANKLSKQGPPGDKPAESEVA